MGPITDLASLTAAVHSVFASDHPKATGSAGPWMATTLVLERILTTTPLVTESAIMAPKDAMGIDLHTSREWVLLATPKMGLDVMNTQEAATAVAAAHRLNVSQAWHHRAVDGAIAVAVSGHGIT